MENNQSCRIILSGNPRVGKTTIIHKIIAIAKGNYIKIAGIMTPEIREHGRRIGFHLVDLKSGEKGILASILETENQSTTFRVGKYKVHQETIKNVAIPALQEALDDPDVKIIFIDEIGKMELLDRNFKEFILDLFLKKEQKPSIIATMGKGISKDIRQKLVNSTENIEVTLNNRDSVAIGLHNRLFGEC